jgi:tetrahydromethanopterin S-methyltransferase subunit G
MANQQYITPDEQNSEVTERLIVQSLAKLDGKALGISIGLLFGLAIFLATNFLLFKGGDVVGPNLALLSQFFIGYQVSFSGSLIGMIYGLIAGFIIGWLIAFVRNFVVALYLHVLKLRGSMSAVNDYLDNP